MDDKKFYLDTLQNISQESDQNELQDIFFSFLHLEHLFDSAIEIVKTQLQIFNNGFEMRFQRNPIHNIESRVKSPQSIINKLQRKGFVVSPDSALHNLNDIAGIRVICYYIDDIYKIYELLSQHSSFTIKKTKDYIKNPKENGYRSFHLILEVPVNMATGLCVAPVEIQIRTIAMDFWASLEHQLHYKSIGDQEISQSLTDELKQCADTISETDIKMQEMFRKINQL